MSKSEPITTEIAAVRRDADGLLWIVFRDGARITEANVQPVVDAHVALGDPDCPVIADLTGITSADNGARQLAASDAVASATGRLALLVGSPVSRVIVNFFLEFAGPRYPVAVFTSERQARDWLLGRDS